MLGVLVRRAGPGDRVLLEPLLGKFEDDYIPLVWDEWVALEPGGVYLAEVDGRPAGMVCIRFVGPGEAYLAGMRVDPDLQGRGLGTEFARAQLEECRRLGARVVRLLTGRDNVRVHRMMATLGLRRVADWRIAQVPLTGRAGRPGEEAAAGGPAAPGGPGGDTGACRTPPCAREALSYLERRSREEGLPGVLSVPGDPWVLKGLRWEEEPPERCLAVAGREGVRGAALVEEGEDPEGGPALVVRWAVADPGAEEPLAAALAAEAARSGAPAVMCTFPAQMGWVEERLRARWDAGEGWGEDFTAYEIRL